jgi:hypothetical protein
MASADGLSVGAPGEFEARKVRGIRLRPMRPDDTTELANSIYETFFALNQSVKIPPHLDFPSIETSHAIMQHRASAPGVYGVVAEEESSGALMGAGLITPGLAYPSLSHNYSQGLH